MSDGLSTSGKTNIDDGEPLDRNPLWYRSKVNSKSIIMDSGDSLEDELKKKYATKEHTHKASDIITDQDHQFISKAEKDYLTGGGRYNKSIPIYQEHGGIKEGMTFENKTMQEMFDMILYPYVSPIVSASVQKPSNGGIFELGSSINVTLIRAVIQIKSNELTSIIVNDGKNNIVEKTSGISKGGTIDLSMNQTLKTNTTYTVKVFDTSGKSTSKNTGTFTFVNPIYHGAALVNGTPTEEIVKSCTKHIETKGTKTYTYNMDNKQMVFAYPASYGRLNKIFDPNNFDVTSTFAVYTIKVTTLSGDKVDYYVYVNNKSTISNFNMKFQW